MHISYWSSDVDSSDLGKVVLYQLSYTRGGSVILPSRSELSTGIPSPARKTGHAARKYAKPDHSVSRAATASSQSPTWKTRSRMNRSCRGARSGDTEYSRHSSATICATVLILQSSEEHTSELQSLMRI